MFGIFDKKTPVSLVTQVAPAALKGAVIKPQINNEELQTYTTLAKEIGLDVARGHILAQQMEIFFAENGVMNYNVQQVHDYMTKLAMKKRKTWVWKPLRQKDKKSGCRYQFEKWSSDLRDAVGKVSPKLYAHTVPLSVIQTVHKIATAFPEEAKFFVTDYEDPKPDPFLAVAIRGKPFWVVEFWNEPGFKPQ